uniref:Zinc finger protein Xfin n=1 Tax=Culex pipiens TaxID=7175 RepID=A0A8D8MFJ7_CULPI
MDQKMPGDEPKFETEVIVKQELILDDDELVPLEGEDEIPPPKCPLNVFKYRCKVCDISFANNNQRKSHVRAHHKPSIFTCAICPKTFKERYLLANHERAHERSNEKVISEFPCQHCNKVFQVLYLYKRHLRKHGAVRFRCSVCPKSYKGRTTLKNHEQVVHNIVAPVADSPKPDPNDPNHCKECGKTLQTRKSYRDHMRRHKNLKEGVFKCIPCKRSFGTNYLLVMHENRVHNKTNAELDELVEIQCKLCNEVFRSQTPHSDLSRHQKEVHRVLKGTVRNVERQFVPEQDFQPEAIVKEELIIDDVFQPCEEVEDEELPQVDGPTEPQSFHCPVCDKSFTCNRKYYTHQRRHRDQAYTCITCKKSFKEKFELERHVKQVHRERPKRAPPAMKFHCSECDKTFTLEKLYKNHMVRHGERIFKCTLCPKSFVLKCDLRKHEKCGHKIFNKETTDCAESKMVDPALHCVECNKYFIQRDTYLNHVRRHRRRKEGAFRCEACQKVFTNNYEMTLHENGIQHKNNVNDPIQCDICQLILSSRRKLERHKKEFHPCSSSALNDDIKQETVIIPADVQQIGVKKEPDESPFNPT